MPPMKLAVIQTGGKQYVVKEGDVLKVEKLPVKEGENVVFDTVLLASTDKTTKIGTPTITGATVAAKAVLQGKSKKVFGVKMKAKKRRKKYFGHRQPYTEVEITKITTK